MPDEMTRARPRGRPPFADVLTPAEWRTVHLVRHGLGDTAIARLFGVSRDAVKFHVANVLSKLGLPDRRALRLWRGIPRASALQREDTKMHGHLVLGPLGQLARGVRDIGESERFYRDVLQLPHLYTFGTLSFFDLGGVRLFLEQAEAGELAGGCLYFRVPDIHAAHVELEARGAHFSTAPHMIHRHADGTEEWMAFFGDPEGRPLAIMQQSPPG
jgi:DNA-binding CsgD family transcriptional regulator/extradiol dioxygenase family protein